MGLYWEVLPTIHWGSINSSSNSTLRSRTVQKMFVFVHIYLYILSNLRFLRLKYIIHWIKYILFSSNTPFRCIVVLCHFQCKRLMNLGAESLFFLCFYFFSFFSFFFLKTRELWDQYHHANKTKVQTPKNFFCCQISLKRPTWSGYLCTAWRIQSTLQRIIDYGNCQWGVSLLFSELFVKMLFHYLNKNKKIVSLGYCSWERYSHSLRSIVIGSFNRVQAYFQSCSETTWPFN